MLSLATGSFILGFSDSLGSISDFGRWLNLTAGVCTACLKTIFVISYRSEMTEFIECVVKLDRTIMQKAKSDFVIRKWRSQCYVFENLMVYSSLFLNCVMGVAFSVPSLLAEQITIPPPATVPWGIDESQLGLTLYFILFLWGCVWGGCVFVCLEFLLGNMFNQFILNFEIVTHEIQKLGRVAEDSDCDKERKLIEILQDYQYLRVSIQSFNRTFQPILLLLVGSNMVLQTFISIELAIMIKVDTYLAIRSAFYLFFINVPFFYWCCLGQRMSDVVSGDVEE